MNTKALMAGAGCGFLMTITYVRAILGPNHHTVLFNHFPLSNLFWAVLLDLIGFSLVAAVAWAFLERITLDSVLWPFLLGGILLLEAYGVVEFQHLKGPDSLWIASAGTLILLGLGLRWLVLPWFKRIVQLSVIGLQICGFYTLLTVPYLAYMAVRTSANEAPGFSRANNLKTITGTNLTWILFDELSYDQTFEHRWPGLELPYFDRVKAESISFTNVEPAAFYTSRAIPAMLLGRPVTNVRGSTAGEISFYFDDSKKWEKFAASQSTLADARRAGWTSGIVGWSNPYCRFLGGWVDSCYWASFDEPLVMTSNMDPRKGVLANVVYPIERWLHWVVPHVASDGNQVGKNYTADHEESYHLVIDQAVKLINDSSIRFKFIHLPIPHPPAIYNRRTHAFSGDGSYVDNLALADLALGELLQALEKTPGWQDTTLIVSGDHSWRPNIWRDNRDNMWTKEDAAAARDKFDPRPVLLIHLAGQSRASTVPEKFQALEMRRMIDAFFHGSALAPNDMISLALKLSKHE